MTEFSRLVSFERPPVATTVEADEAERAALAQRFGIVAVEALRCSFKLRTEQVTVMADGVLEAEVVQSCVVSLDPVTQHVAESFTVRFVSEGHEAESDELDQPDEIPVHGDSMDLGEAAAEQLALALDPYPRRPDAEMDGLGGDEGDTGPFSGLAALRPKE